MDLNVKQTGGQKGHHASHITTAVVLCDGQDSRSYGMDIELLAVPRAGSCRDSEKSEIRNQRSVAQNLTFTHLASPAMTPHASRPYSHDISVITSPSTSSLALSSLLLMVREVASGGCGAGWTPKNDPILHMGPRGRPHFVHFPAVFQRRTNLRGPANRDSAGPRLFFIFSRLTVSSTACLSTFCGAADSENGEEGERQRHRQGA